MTWKLILILVSGFGLDILNGIHESSNIVATMVSTRAIRPRPALLLTVLCVFIGPLIFGTAVAATIGQGIITPAGFTLKTLLAVMLTLLLWNFFTWQIGLPSSSTHALLGAMLGSVLVTAGSQAILWNGVLKVIFFLFATPVISAMLGWLVITITYLLSWKASTRINRLFNIIQILVSIPMSLGYGANGAQKTMGLLTIALMIGGILPNFHVPIWIICFCALAISIGTLTGGRQLIRTLGTKFYRLRPVHGMSVQISSAAMIITASFAGAPVSTSQVISSGIIGVGASDRFKQVRWQLVGEIVLSWLVTIPAAGLIAAGLTWLIVRLLPFF